ncbi:MAG: hypothetical protein ACUVQ0_05255 [Thermoproteota archaeon]
MPRFEVSGEAKPISDESILFSERVFRDFLESEYKRYLIMPLTLLDISKDTESPIQIVPVDEFTVTISGQFLDLLILYACEAHEATHMHQISHLEVLRKYVDMELAIYALNSVLKESRKPGSPIDFMLQSAMMNQAEDELTIGSTGFKNLINSIKESAPYLPLKINREKLVLLESLPLLDQLLVVENPGVELLKETIKDSIRNDINSRLIKIISEDPENKNYLEAFALVSSLSEIIPKHYLTLLFYSTYLTGFGVQELLEMTARISKDENRLRILAGIGKEVENELDRLDMAFERGVFDYDELARHRENLLKILDDALKICRKGGSFQRLNTVRRKVSNAKKPSDFALLAGGFCQTFFRQHLTPDRPATYYLQANGEYSREEAMIFASFFADLAIATNMLRAMPQILERGGDFKNLLGNIIRCPLKRAPQLNCMWSAECEHEKPWLDAISHL